MNRPAGSRVYRVLLHVLPRQFRLAHAAEMEELFREALRARRSRGRTAWLTAWARGTADVVFLAVRLWVGSVPAGGAVVACCRESRWTFSSPSGA